MNPTLHLLPEMELLYLEALGEVLEVGVGVRRYGALFERRADPTSAPTLYPMQFLGIEDEGALWIVNPEGGVP